MTVALIFTRDIIVARSNGLQRATSYVDILSSFTLIFYLLLFYIMQVLW